MKQNTDQLQTTAEQISRFVSAGAAWQWLIDNTPIQSDQLIKFAEKINCSDFDAIYAIRRIYENGQTIEQITKKIDEMAEQKAADDLEQYKLITAAYNLQSFVDGIADSANTPAISTGFERLNKELEGGLYEGLYIIGAISSLGKTTFVMQVADQIAMQGQDVLIISLEMARTELMAKSISRHTVELATAGQYGGRRNAKTARGITDGARYEAYSQAERELIKTATAQYATYADHLFIMEGLEETSVIEVRAAVERHKAITGRTPVVIVDYLQILHPFDIKASDKMNIDKAVSELKRISRDLKTPVISISSFNRANYDKKADMAAFKESGSIEYSSDVLMSLTFKGVEEKDFDVNKAKRHEPREIELTILKNRMAATGAAIAYDYYPAFNLFKEQ